MGRKRMHTGFWYESQKEIEHYEERDLGGSILLKWTLENAMMGWCGLE
jgi:hypothetical protein